MNFPQSSLERYPVKDNITTDERYLIQRYYPEKQKKIPDFGKSSPMLVHDFGSRGSASRIDPYNNLKSRN